MSSTEIQKPLALHKLCTTNLKTEIAQNKQKQKLKHAKSKHIKI